VAPDSPDATLSGIRPSPERRAIWLNQREPPSDIASCNVVHAETLPADCEALLKCDTVCHVAAFARLEDPKFARQYFEASALLTLQLALAAARNSKIKFVYFSLGQGYLVPPGCPSQETDSLLSRSTRSFLIREQAAGRDYVENLRRQRSSPWHLLHIGSICGDGMRANFVPAIFIEQARRGKPPCVRHGGLPSCDFVSRL